MKTTFFVKGQVFLGFRFSTFTQESYLHMTALTNNYPIT